MPAPASSVKSLQSLRRGLDVLAFVEQAESTTFMELQRATGVPKATLLRMLKTLSEAGRVEYRDADRRYVAIAHSASLPPVPTQHAHMLKVAAPVYRALQQRVAWPLVLAVRDDRAMLIVEAVGAPNSLAMNHRALGARPPMLISSLGRCYLAFCPDDELNEIVDLLGRSPHPHDSAARRPAQLKRALAAIRAQGYATREASVTSPDSAERFGAMSVPIFHDGRLVACMAVSWLPGAVNVQQMIATHLAPMQDAAQLITHRLG